MSSTLHDTADWYWIGAPPKDKENGCFLPAEVIRTGWIDREQALHYMAMLDIYVQTSRWEGLSYAMLEAMAMGKPVVATDIPPNRAIIQHGITGLLGKDADTLTAHVRTLLNDADMRQRMGAAARDYVHTHHNAASTYAAYRQLYHRLRSRT